MEEKMESKSSPLLDSVKEEVLSYDFFSALPLLDSEKNQTFENQFDRLESFKKLAKMRVQQIINAVQNIQTPENNDVAKSIAVEAHELHRFMESDRVKIAVCGVSSAGKSKLISKIWNVKNKSSTGVTTHTPHHFIWVTTAPQEPGVAGSESSPSRYNSVMSYTLEFNWELALIHECYREIESVVQKINSHSQSEKDEKKSLMLKQVWIILDQFLSKDKSFSLGNRDYEIIQQFLCTKPKQVKNALDSEIFDAFHKIVKRVLVEVHLKEEDLHENPWLARITLIDCPGFNANQSDNEIADEEIRYSDCALFLFPQDQIHIDHTKESWESLIKDGIKSPEQITLVCTKSDSLKGQAVDDLDVDGKGDLPPELIAPRLEKLIVEAAQQIQERFELKNANNVFVVSSLFYSEQGYKDLSNLGKLKTHICKNSRFLEKVIELKILQICKRINILRKSFADVLWRYMESKQEVFKRSYFEWLETLPLEQKITDLKTLIRKADKAFAENIISTIVDRAFEIMKENHAKYTSTMYAKSTLLKMFAEFWKTDYPKYFKSEYSKYLKKLDKGFSEIFPALEEEKEGAELFNFGNGKLNSGIYEAVSSLTEHYLKDVLHVSFNDWLSTGIQVPFYLLSGSRVEYLPKEEEKQAEFFGRVKSELIQWIERTPKTMLHRDVIHTMKDRIWKFIEKNNQKQQEVSSALSIKISVDLTKLIKEMEHENLVSAHIERLQASLEEKMKEGKEKADIRLTSRRNDLDKVEFDTVESTIQFFKKFL